LNKGPIVNTPKQEKKWLSSELMFTPFAIKSSIREKKIKRYRPRNGEKKIFQRD